VNGFKNIENRTWPTRVRGPVLIHASKGMTGDEYEDAFDLALEQGIQLPAFEHIERGGIVGVANIDGCVSASSSPWFFGPQGFLLSDAKPLPFVPFKGMLGFFDVPDELVQFK
jgi:hypothetical protein